VSPVRDIRTDALVRKGGFVASSDVVRTVGAPSDAGWNALYVGDHV